MFPHLLICALLQGEFPEEGHGEVRLRLTQASADVLAKVPDLKRWQVAPTMSRGAVVSAKRDLGPEKQNQAEKKTAEKKPHTHKRNKEEDQHEIKKTRERKQKFSNLRLRKFTRV